LRRRKEKGRFFLFGFSFRSLPGVIDRRKSSGVMQIIPLKEIKSLFCFFFFGNKVLPSGLSSLKTFNVAKYRKILSGVE